MEIDIGLEISTGLKEIKKGLERTPRAYRTLFKTGVVAAGTTTLQVDMGYPSVGRIWSVTAITMVGLDDHTAVTGTVAVYASSVSDQNLGALLVPSAAVPSQTTFSDASVIVCASEGLSVSGVGMSAGATLSVIIKVIESVDLPGGPRQIQKY